jgi:hypothetical protein
MVLAFMVGVYFLKKSAAPLKKTINLELILYAK